MDARAAGSGGPAAGRPDCPGRPTEPEHAVAADETLTECTSKLRQLLPRVARGLRRRSVPEVTQVAEDEHSLGPRHGAALSLVRELGPSTVGRLATDLGLSLATVSGTYADLERAGFIVRTTDPDDRRRTIISLAPGRGDAVGEWLDGASAPLARALGRLSPDERAIFVKAMSYLEAELATEPVDGLGP